MNNAVQILTYLVIQYAVGFTKTGRIARKSQTIGFIRPDVTKGEILAVIAIISPAMIGEIIGVKLVQKTITTVWTPEMRVQLEEETLASVALKRQAQQDTHLANAPGTSRLQRNSIGADFVSKEPTSNMSAVSSNTASTAHSAASANTAVTGTPVSTAMPTAPGAIIGEETAPKKSMLGKLHDFFIDDSYKNWTPIEEPVLAMASAKTGTEMTQEGGMTMETANEPDYSYMLKGTQWDPDPATRKAPEKSRDFLTQLRENDFKITIEELNELTHRNPFANTTARKEYLTPFKDLDPLIYGEVPPGG